MNYLEFSKKLKEQKLANCYLFHGEEEYIKQRQLEKLRKIILQPADFAEMNETVLNDPAAEDVIAACETLPLLAEKRLVIVRDSKFLLVSRKKDSSEEDTDESKAKPDSLSEYIAKLPETVRLVFYVKGKAASNKKLFRACQEHGVIVEYKLLTPQEAAENIYKNILAKGVRIEKATAQRMVFTIGCDFGLLEQEMDKLVAYVGEGNLITNDDIQAICTPTTECTVFEAVEAQVAGDLQKALHLFDNLKKNGEDDMFILSMLLRQYRILYHMRCLIEEKVPDGQQASLLGIPPFMIKETRAQAMKYSKEKLRLAYDELLRTEYRIKQGKQPAEDCGAISVLRLNVLLNQA